MWSIINSLIRALDRGESVVLVRIIQSAGSAPRTSGAVMLMLADGSLEGTIGGGSIEGACHREAKQLLSSSLSHKELYFNLTPEDAASDGMVCGGSVRVLLHRVEPTDLSRFTELNQARAKRPVLITELCSDSLRLMMLATGRDHEVPAAVRAKISAARHQGAYSFTLDGKEFFIEPLASVGTVHLAGGGHVAVAVADMASYVEFETVVMDDRVEFANRQRFPQASEIRVIKDFADCFTDLNQDDYVVIVTRGHQHDLHVLAQALRTNAGYIGMIGSSKKRKAVYDALLSQGVKQQDIDRVHSPIGLNIGSDTPQEIGLSIVAELVQVRAGMKAKPTMI